jgi:hypothetical protein
MTMITLHIDFHGQQSHLAFHGTLQRLVSVSMSHQSLPGAPPLETPNRSRVQMAVCNIHQRSVQTRHPRHVLEVQKVARNDCTTKPSLVERLVNRPSSDLDLHVEGHGRLNYLVKVQPEMSQSMRMVDSATFSLSHCFALIRLNLCV